MLVHRARDRTDRLLDFFVAAPGLGRAAARAARWTSIDIDFDGEHDAGLPDRRRRRARCPGAAAGLEAAHRGLRDAPVGAAVRAGARARPRRRRADAAAGVPARDPRPRSSGTRARGGAIYGRRVAARRGRPARAGRPRRRRSRSSPRKGAAAIYGGSLGREIVRHLRATGGAITRADLAAYRVVRRRPVRGALPRPRVRLEPAAVVGRRADRLRAAAARPARPERRRRAARTRSPRLVGGDARAGARARGQLRARALPRRARAAALLGREHAGGAARDPRRPRRRAGAGRAGHDAHLRRRRGRERRVADGVDRLGLGRDRPRHGDPPEQHARRVRPQPGRRGGPAGLAADEHDGAVDRRSAAAGRGSSSAAPGRCGCAVRSCRWSSTSSTTGSASRRRSPRRASTSTSRTSTARAGPTRPSSTGSRRRGYDVVRWRRRNLYFGGVAAVEVGAGRRARRGRRPAPRRARDRGRVTAIARPPGPARRRAALVALAEAVGSEPEGWLISDSRWRSVGDERRYLRAVRRHPDAAVFVAEDGDGHRRAAVGRARPASGEPARRRPRPDGRRAGARRQGVGWALLEQAVAWARQVGRPEARAARLPAQRAGDPALRALRLRPRGLPQAALPARPRLRGRDPDGVRGSGRARSVAYSGRDLAVARGALAHLALAGERVRRPGRAARRAAEPLALGAQLEQLLLQLVPEVDPRRELERERRRRRRPARRSRPPRRPRRGGGRSPASARPRPRVGASPSSSSGSTSAVRNDRPSVCATTRKRLAALDEDVHPAVVEGVRSARPRPCRVPISRSPSSSSRISPNSLPSARHSPISSL